MQIRVYLFVVFHVDLHVTCNFWNIDTYSRGSVISRLKHVVTILTTKPAVSSETSAHFYQLRRRHTPAEVTRSFVLQTNLITMPTKDFPRFCVQ
jgi:hypothetical protein